MGFLHYFVSVKTLESSELFYLMSSSTLLHGFKESLDEIFDELIIGLPNVEVAFFVEVVVDRVGVRTLDLVSLSFTLSAGCLYTQLVISLLFVVRDDHFRVPLHRLPALELGHLHFAMHTHKWS